jgi:hypothetical protein
MTTSSTSADPTTIIEGAPATFAANPQNPTACLMAAMQVITWAGWLQAQHLGAITLAVPPPPPPPPPPPAQQLITLTQVQLQAILTRIPAPIINVAAPAPATAPAAAGTPHVKVNIPTYNGKASKAHGYITKCENYFVLNTMTDKQKVRFTLQGISTDGYNWKCHQLLIQHPHPAHFA